MIILHNSQQFPEVYFTAHLLEHLCTLPRVLSINDIRRLRNINCEPNLIRGNSRRIIPKIVSIQRCLYIFIMHQSQQLCCLQHNKILQSSSSISVVFPSLLQPPYPSRHQLLDTHGKFSAIPFTLLACSILKRDVCPQEVPKQIETSQVLGSGEGLSKKLTAPSIRTPIAGWNNNVQSGYQIVSSFCKTNMPC